jgi:hypothetical protein
MPYADGAAAQTGANEAAKGRVRPIKTYPTLWPIVVIGYLRRGGHLVLHRIYARVSMSVCVLVVFNVTTAELSRVRKRSGAPTYGNEGN